MNSPHDEFISLSEAGNFCVDCLTGPCLDGPGCNFSGPPAGTIFPVSHFLNDLKSEMERIQAILPEGYIATDIGVICQTAFSGFVGVKVVNKANETMYIALLSPVYMSNLYPVDYKPS